METTTLFQMEKVPHMAIVRKINDIVDDATGHERAMYHLAKEIVVGLVKEAGTHTVCLDVRIEKSNMQIGFHYGCFVHIYDTAESSIAFEFIYSNVKAGYIGSLEPIPVPYDGDNVGWFSSISEKKLSTGEKSFTAVF